MTKPISLTFDEFVQGNENMTISASRKGLENFILRKRVLRDMLTKKPLNNDRIRFDETTYMVKNGSLYITCDVLGEQALLLAQFCDDSPQIDGTTMTLTPVGSSSINHLFYEPKSMTNILKNSLRRIEKEQIQKRRKG
jgi:hypothetical protein